MYGTVKIQIFLGEKIYLGSKRSKYSRRNMYFCLKKYLIDQGQV